MSERDLASFPNRGEGADATSGWDRLSAELRAGRDAQQKAWGGLDDTTLGRYLSGQVSQEERGHIEQELAERPELRQLTDLVRDVLAEFEAPAATGRVVVPAAEEGGPVRLSFEETKARRTFPARRRGVLRFIERHASLAAAACLVLTIGMAMPRPRPWSAREADHEVVEDRSSGGMASRPAHLVFGRAEGPPHYTTLIRPITDDRAPASEMDNFSTGPTHRVAFARPALPGRDGVVSSLGEADLDRAAEAYTRAHSICCKALGPNHPATLVARNNLANVYQVALAAPPLTGTTFREVAMAPPSRPDPAVSPYLPPPRTMAGRPPGPPRKGKKPSDAGASARALRARLMKHTPAELEQQVVPVLLQGWQQATTSSERTGYVHALGNLGPAASAAVPVLAPGLKTTDDPLERRAVLLMMGQLGPEGKSAVPHLVKALGGKCAVGRESAAEALVALGPTATLPVKHEVRRQHPAPPLLGAVDRHLHGPDGRIGVLDGASCFTLGGLRGAQAHVRRLAHQHGVEVLFHTARDGRAAREAPVSAAPPARSGRLYVFATRDGKVVRVEADAKLRAAGVDPEAVTATVRAAFQAHQYDRGLAEVLARTARATRPVP